LQRKASKFLVERSKMSILNLVHLEKPRRYNSYPNESEKIETIISSFAVESAYTLNRIIA
jgi:hypothetical protein